VGTAAVTTDWTSGKGDKVGQTGQGTEGHLIGGKGGQSGQGREEQEGHLIIGQIFGGGQTVLFTWGQIIGLSVGQIFSGGQSKVGQSKLLAGKQGGQIISFSIWQLVWGGQSKGGQSGGGQKVEFEINGAVIFSCK